MEEEAIARLRSVSFAIVSEKHKSSSQEGSSRQETWATGSRTIIVRPQ
jgi:hypothetical protein